MSLYWSIQDTVFYSLYKVSLCNGKKQSGQEKTEIGSTLAFRSLRIHKFLILLATTFPKAYPKQTASLGGKSILLGTAIKEKENLSFPKLFLSMLFPFQDSAGF